MSTSKRQPRFIVSKFDGKCADCGRTTRAGERVYWRARGEVECGDCAAFNQRDGAPATIQAAPQPASVGADSDPAMAWDDTPPSAGASIGQRNGTDPHAASNRLIANAVARDPELRAQVTAPVADTGRKFGAHHPNADNCDECGQLDELSHNDHTGTALCGECDDAANAAANVVEIDSARPKAPSGDTLDATCATVCDLLVTLVNAVDRLDGEQCDALRAHAEQYAASSASGSRRRTWQAFAKFIA